MASPCLCAASISHADSDYKIYKISYYVDMNARNLMNSPVVVVEESTTLEQAARLMLEKGIGCLPVVDSQ